MGGKEPPRLEGYAQRDEETTPEVFEVSGSVKWFDPSKGYGFIAPDEGLPDVLLHVTCLRRGGFQTACEGARVVCEVVRSSKGLQAVRVCSMDNSTAIPPSQLPQRTHVVATPRERLGKSGCKVVQPITGVWLSYTRSGDTRHFCAYGNTAPLRFHRAQAWPDRACALRPGTKRFHRGRPQIRQCFGAIVSLTFIMRARCPEPTAAPWRQVGSLVGGECARLAA